MRLLGGLLAAVAALLFLAAAALYGANIFLQQDGGEITAAVRKYFPGAEVGFRAARFRLSWEGVALRAEELSVKDGGGNSLHAPEADFWLRPGGAAVVLRAPVFVVRRDKNAAAGLPGGGWALAATNAELHYYDSDSGAAVSLHNANLQIKSEDGEWRAELEKPGALRVRAVARQKNGILHGAAHAEFFGRPPGLPKEWEMKTTVRAEFGGGAVSLVAGGELRGGGGKIQWHGAGEFLDGKLSATLAAAAPQLSLFAGAPAAAAYARGPLQYESGKWQWRGRAVASGKDGKLRADIVVRGELASVSAAVLSVRIAEIPARALWRYAPVPEVRAWLSESLAEGAVQLAEFQVRGSGAPLRAEITGLTAAFSGVRIRIAEGWPDAKHLNGVLAMRGGDILIAGEGQIAGAAARNISVRIAVSEEPGMELAADFYRAPLADYLAAARALPPAREKIEALAREAKLSGDSRLSVFVSLPFAAPENGDFHAALSLAGNGAIRVAGMPPFFRASGAAEIDGNGARATVRGVLDGNLATLFVHNGGITLRGRIAAKRAAAIANFTAAPIGGEASFELRRDARGTVFLSDLHGVSVSLPPPLAKAAEDAAMLSVRADSSGVRGELKLGGNVFRAVLNGGADIAINAALAPPPEKGVYVHGVAGGADNVGAWMAQGGGADIAMSLLVINSTLFGAFHHYLLVRSSPPKNGARTIILQGEDAAGTVFLDGGILRADFSRLLLGAAGGGADVYDLTVSVAVADFNIGGAALGSLQIYGEPADGGWILRNAQLKNGANILRLTGGYDGAQTSIAISLDAPEASALLAALGHGGVISEGGAAFSGGLFWPQTPSDFSLGAVRGGISLRAEDLRYLNADSGVLSFLAVFSPQSLLRLGFTEIGKEGIRLNTMDGEINFLDGAAEFKDFLMKNDDVNISLEGAADLQTRTLKLNGRVRPGHRLLGAGSVVTIAGGIAAVQPLSLAAGWFLGKIFEKPLSEIGAYNYTITGPWEDPVYAETGVTFTEPTHAP